MCYTIVSYPSGELILRPKLIFHFRLQYVEMMGHSGVRAYWPHPVLAPILAPLGMDLIVEDHVSSPIFDFPIPANFSLVSSRTSTIVLARVVRARGK